MRKTSPFKTKQQFKRKHLILSVYNFLFHLLCDANYKIIIKRYCFKMDDSDREKIKTNISKLVLRTHWNDKLECSLIEKNVFKPKMINIMKSGTKDQEMWIRQLYLGK